MERRRAEGEELDRANDLELIIAAQPLSVQEQSRVRGSIHFDAPNKLFAAFRPDDKSSSLLAHG